MKTIKTILLVIWGFLTIGLLLLALIQRQDAIKSRNELTEDQKIIFNDYIKILDEYARNMELVRTNSSMKTNIDSIYKSSEFLKSYMKNKKP